ncbi:MAG: 4'-phosphopantetheinyl transferase superfamily protein [Paludibacteraceae bacterium]|nr:4'-phosphopantetheinyl transferase superfamily protein [Paludibacteraceae bacterium]
MQYLIFDDMTQCSELEVARMLPLVSEQRREQALRYTHTFGQYCCLKSYELLQQLLASCRYPISNSPLGRPIAALPRPIIASERRPLNTPTFLYNEHGAPYLEDGPCFSISHCKQGIAVVVSDRPVGIDIEGLRKVDEGLVRKTMNIVEQAQIAAAANSEQEFIRLWTRKEAYVKMLGTGIISDMHTILQDATAVEWQEIVDLDRGYICTICTICTKNEQK